MTPKEQYEARKVERKARRAHLDDQGQLDIDAMEIMGRIADSFERIAGALERLAGNELAQDSEGDET